jgi:hypothetical protein
LSRVVFRGSESGGALQDSVGEDSSFENKNDLVMSGELSAAIGDSRAGLSPLAADGRRLSPKMARVTAAGVVASALILGGVYLMPPIFWPRLAQSSRAAPAQQPPVVIVSAGAIRPPNVEAVADPATAFMLQPAEIHRDAETFRFAIRDVHQKDADAFLVENVGMKKWMDQFMFPRISYWAPEANNREGMLVYRFDFGGISESIRMRAQSNCWDYFREPGGVGRGTSAIEVSPDGDQWVVLADNIEAGRWGASITVDKDLRTDLLGSDSLWVRVRCITESAPVENGYNVAQFARTRPGYDGAVFEVVAALRQNEPE